MEKKKLYWIRGNEQNPEGVRKALEQKGLRNINKDGNEIYAFDSDPAIYCGCEGERIFCFSINSDLVPIIIACGEELQPIARIKALEHEFKPFDKILRTQGAGEPWLPDFYGYRKAGYDCTIDGVSYGIIIPYEGNEHLLGTIYKPKE